MFSYGSGAVGTAFILRGRKPDGRRPFTLARMQKVTDIPARLAARATRDVAAFRAAMDLRAARYATCDYEPTGPVEGLFPGTYYLSKVDKLYRRTYARA